MDIKKITTVVETLNKKAAEAGDSADAMRCAQAALNAAHAFATMAGAQECLARQDDALEAADASAE